MTFGHGFFERAPLHQSCCKWVLPGSRPSPPWAPNPRPHHPTPKHLDTPHPLARRSRLWAWSMTHQPPNNRQPACKASHLRPPAGPVCGRGGKQGAGAGPCDDGDAAAAALPRGRHPAAGRAARREGQTRSGFGVLGCWVLRESGGLEAGVRRAGSCCREGVRPGGGYRAEQCVRRASWCTGCQRQAGCASNPSARIPRSHPLPTCSSACKMAPPSPRPPCTLGREEERRVCSAHPPAHPPCTTIPATTPNPLPPPQHHPHPWLPGEHAAVCAAG